MNSNVENFKYVERRRIDTRKNYGAQKERHDQRDDGCKVGTCYKTIDLLKTIVSKSAEVDELRVCACNLCNENASLRRKIEAATKIGPPNEERREKIVPPSEVKHGEAIELVSRLNKEMLDLKKERKKDVDKVNMHRSEVESLKDENFSLSKERDELKDRLCAIFQESKEKDAMIVDLKEEIHDITKRSDSLEDTAKEKEEDIDKLQQIVILKDKTLSEAAINSEKKDIEMKKVTMRLKDIEGEVKINEELVKNLRTELDSRKFNQNANAIDRVKGLPSGNGQLKRKEPPSHISSMNVKPEADLLSSSENNVLVMTKLPVTPKEKMVKLCNVVEKITKPIGKVRDLYMPFDDIEGASCGVCFVLHDRIDEVDKAVEELDHRMLDSKYMLEAHSCKKVVDLEVAGEKICKLFDSVNKSRPVVDSE